MNRIAFGVATEQGSGTRIDHGSPAETAASVDSGWVLGIVVVPRAME